MNATDATMKALNARLHDLQGAMREIKLCFSALQVFFQPGPRQKRCPGGIRG